MPILATIYAILVPTSIEEQEINGDDIVRWYFVV